MMNICLDFLSARDADAVWPCCTGSEEEAVGVEVITAITLMTFHRTQCSVLGTVNGRADEMPWHLLHRHDTQQITRSVECYTR